MELYPAGLAVEQADVWTKPALAVTAPVAWLHPGSSAFSTAAWDGLTYKETLVNLP